MVTCALFVASASVASATPMFIQTASALPADLTDTSRIISAGANIFPDLTPDAPGVRLAFITGALRPFGGTKSSSTATLTARVSLIQEPALTSVFAGTFAVPIPVVETVVAGVPTFSTPGGAAVYQALTNGHYLQITPLANSNFGSSSIVKATFELLSAPPPPPGPIPEPASVLLTGCGIAGAVLLDRRRRIARSRHQ